MTLATITVPDYGRNNHGSCMIPDFDMVTGYLPNGQHPASWDEVEHRFGWNDHRRRLLQGLLRLATALRDGGCRFFVIDGSFVTAKELPSDFDACCDYQGMSPIELYRLRLMSGKDVMKAEYRGEVYAYAERVPTGHRFTFLEFFQRDRDEIPKGVVLLNLSSLP